MAIGGDEPCVLFVIGQELLFLFVKDRQSAVRADPQPSLWIDIERVDNPLVLGRQMEGGEQPCAQV